MFITALFTTAKNWKHFRYSSITKQIKDGTPTQWNTIQQYKGTKYWYILQLGWTSKHDAKWKKPDAKGSIFHQSIYMKF